MKNKLTMFLLAAVMAVATSLFAVTASASTQRPSDEHFIDRFDNGRVTAVINNDGTTSLELAVPNGEYALTRAYYSKNINISNVFETEIKIDQFNVDGAFRLSFLSSNDDFPLSGYGDGFGVYFWDMSAWHPDDPVLTYLRCDYYAYGKAGGTQEVAAKNAFLNTSYVGKTMYVKVWNFDDNNLAIQINTDGTHNADTAASIGTVAKSVLPAGFNYENCVLMITPDIDGYRAHSYANSVKLTISGLTSMTTYYDVTATAGEHGSVTVSNASVTAGTNVTFTVTPEGGYEVDTAKLNGTEVTLNGTTYTATVNGDTTFEVTFKETEIPVTYYNVTATAGEHGSVTASQEGSVAEDTEVTFTVTPDFAYKASSATLNGNAVELVNNTYTATVTGDMAFAVEFTSYSTEGSDFSDAMLDQGWTSINRVDAVKEDGKTALTLAVTDGQSSITRAAYKDRISLSLFEAELTLDTLNLDAGFRISFLATLDDYPMEGYGDGLCVYFWDETAWGHPAFTWFRSDYYVYGRDGTKTCVAEKRAHNNENESVVGLTVYVKVWEFDDGNLAIQVNMDGTRDPQTAGAIGTVPKSALPDNFNFKDCILMITPQSDNIREHSHANEVQLTINELNVTAAEKPEVIEPDPNEYSITYYDGETVLRIAYADEGDNFAEYVPEKEGYNFIGWYLDGEFETVYVYAPASEDVVVYAKFEKENGETTEPGTESSETLESCFGGISSATAFGLAIIILAAGLFAFKKKG